jgi:hypothetical protein
MKRFLLLLAILLSGQANAQTAFLDKREFSARNGLTRVKLGVSHTRQHAVDLSVRLKQAGKDEETPGTIISEGIKITPDHFKIPPGKIRRVTIAFETDVAKRTPYFACVLYQPQVERNERSGPTGGSMSLATESCSRFWVVP